MSGIIGFGCTGRNDRLLFQAPILLAQLIEIAELEVVQSANRSSHITSTSFQRLVTRVLTPHILLAHFDLAIPRSVGTLIRAPNSTTFATWLIARALDLMCVTSMTTIPGALAWYCVQMDGRVTHATNFLL